MNSNEGWITQAVFSLVAIIMVSLLIFFIYSGNLLVGGGGGYDKHGCVPSDFTLSNTTGGHLNIDLPLIEKTIKAEIGLDQKAERISSLLSNEQTADKLRYELCISASNGRISKEKYEEFIEEILPKIKDNIEQRVSIYRRADFSQSGCSNDSKPIDIAVFDDIVTLSRKQLAYTAFSSVEDGMHVDVFDLAVSKVVPVSPTPTPMNGHILNTYNISVGSDRKARVRYVWKDSHYGREKPGIGILGITSKLFLWEASGELIVPDGVTVEAVAEPFNQAVKNNCVRTTKKSFNCTNLNNPDAVLFKYAWDLWASCRNS